MGDERVALFGGSFDPIHHGHLIIAQAICEQLGLDRVIFLPSADPPHKPKGLAATIEHRMEMVRVAIAGHPRFDLDDFDARRAGPTYTLDTVRHFAAATDAPSQLCWIIGSDSLAELHTWHRAAELVDACDIVTAARRGSISPDIELQHPMFTPEQVARLRDNVLQTPHIDISSTDIRQRVADGQSIHYLVPNAVGHYIAEHELYRGLTAERAD